MRKKFAFVMEIIYFLIVFYNLYTFVNFVINDLNEENYVLVKVIINNFIILFFTITLLMVGKLILNKLLYHLGYTQLFHRLKKVENN